MVWQTSLTVGKCNKSPKFMPPIYDAWPHMYACNLIVCVHSYAGVLQLFVIFKMGAKKFAETYWKTMCTNQFKRPLYIMSAEHQVCDAWCWEYAKQWRNSRGGGKSAPRHLFVTEKFLLTYHEKRGKENRENGEEKKENQKREDGKLKMEGGKCTKRRGEDFFSSSSFFLFTFQNHWNLFWVYQSGNFYREKAYLTSRKNPEKWLLSLKNIPFTPLHAKVKGIWLSNPHIYFYSPIFLNDYTASNLLTGSL